MTPQQEALVVNNLRLVPYFLGKRNAARSDFDDLVAAGYLGLIAAAKRFDPSRGYRFSTYAQSWILHYAQQYRIQNASPITIAIRPGAEAMRCLRKNVSPKDECTRAAMAVLRMERWECGVDQFTPGSPFEPAADDNATERFDTADWSAHALEVLDDEERDLVRRILGFDGPAQSPRTIARDIGLSHTTIRQRYKAALDKIRAAAPP